MQQETDIQFVIFGGGSGYASAEEKARTLTNVFIHPLMPQNCISAVYSMGDVALITCRKGIGRSGMPSKTWSIMACNTPIIASFDADSDLAFVLERGKSGICVPPENAKLLKDQIMIAFGNKTTSKKNTRDYVCQIASKQECVKEYVGLINLCESKTETIK